MVNRMVAEAWIQSTTRCSAPTFDAASLRGSIGGAAWLRMRRLQLLPAKVVEASNQLVPVNETTELQGVCKGEYVGRCSRRKFPTLTKFKLLSGSVRRVSQIYSAKVETAPVEAALMASLVKLRLGVHRGSGSRNKPALSRTAPGSPI